MLSLIKNTVSRKRASHGSGVLPPNLYYGYKHRYASLLKKTKKRGKIIMEEKEIIRRIKLVYQDLEGVLANMRLLKRSGISPELQHILNEHIGLIDTDNHMLVRMIEDMERHQEQDSDTPNIC